MSNNKDNHDYLHKLRHSSEHVLTMAMLRLYPGLKPAMGPATDDGYYLDFDFGGKISEADFPKIEKEMTKIIKEDLPITRDEMSVEEAREFFSSNIYKGNQYKYEWLDEIESRDEKVSIYWMGEKGQDIPQTFVDICSGPHANSTGEIKAFKLLSIAGAYWRGDEKNKMLTRIYGTTFESQQELDEYLHLREEAKKRDHRKLGKELDLFTFSDLVGAGLPLFTPKGTILRNELQKALLDASKKHGFQPVTIPHIAKRKLYEISGHAEKFADELIKVVSKYDEFVMKPVNCPHHTQIYASRPRSYRDLPLRYMESTMQYRDEKPGEIGGLTRVRSISVDDGHTFCRVDQIKEEATHIAKIIEEFYKGLGLWGNHWVSLSVRDPETPEAYIGTPEDWEQAEEMLKQVSNELNLDAKRIEGEAALYGPKLDYMFKDSLGKEQQLSTIQLDFAMPKRFNLTYTDPNGKDATPVMLHRAILGSYERFLAILIEHFAGAFPLWLSPTQVHMIPVSEDHVGFAKNLAQEFLSHDIRVEVDSSNETVGNKIRKAAQQKTPYILVIGDKEKESGKFTIRKRDQEEQESMEKTTFIELVQKEIKEKTL